MKKIACRQCNVWVVDANDTVEYTYGLLNALAEDMSVMYITKISCRLEIPCINIKKWFYSDTTKSKINMGINYIITYVKIIFSLFFHKVDIIHIQWCKLEKLDYFFIKILKRFVKVIYTAHNVLPHVDGDLKKADYAKIYQAVDKIIVHGENIRAELLNEFDVCKNKIFIQPYGFSMLQNFKQDTHGELLRKVESLKKSYEKVVMCLGLISHYKGTDRILKIWNTYMSKSPYALVIAGLINESFEELDRELEQKSDNIIFENRKLTDYEFNELSKMADVIILPYRNASMSGVIYSAARTKTTILTTNSGTIPEYLENGIDSLVVENNEDSIKNGLLKMLAKDNFELKKMGIKLYENFEIKYEWKSIVKELIERCYLKNE